MEERVIADSVARWACRTAARGFQVQRKDKDLMSDTGGISKGRDREPEQKPPRDDVRERYRDRRLDPGQKKEGEDGDREVTKTNRRGSAHPLDRMVSGIFGDIPEENYHRAVYRSLWNILENENRVSEKDFAGQDEIRAMCEEVIRSPEAEVIIQRFSNQGLRPQYCAESVYHQRGL